MALNKENARTTSMRSKIDTLLAEGVSLVSPTLSVWLGGIQKSAQGGDLTPNRFRNVLWNQGGTAYEWRVWKASASATRSTGELKVRDFDQPDLLASPSISYYMYEKTWGVGEGDMELNKNAGPQKIRDIKKDRLLHARNCVFRTLAGVPWGANETGQNAGFTLFSPTNVSSATSYAGIAINNSYWTPTGYDYGTKTIAANLYELMGAIKAQMTFSSTAVGGQRVRPDAAACDPTLWPYILAYAESKMAVQVQTGTLPRNQNLVEDGFDNVVIHGITLYADENFGGSTGYIDSSATEEILVFDSSQCFVATTFSQSDGLMVTRQTTQDNEAFIAGQVGVVKTGMMAFGFKNPRAAQILYT